LAARQDERVISRRAWQQGLALIPNATNERNVILSDSVVRDLIAEAYNQSRELGLFVELAAVTGARPSQIVRLEVRDLQDGCEPRLTMPASRKGKGKKAKSHLGGSRRTARRAGSASERAAGHAAERKAVEANEPRLPVPASGESLRSRSGRSDDVRLAA
jgi:integrase